jgi:hypothetical protein
MRLRSERASVAVMHPLALAILTLPGFADERALLARDFFTPFPAED